MEEGHADAVPEWRPSRRPSTIAGIPETCHVEDKVHKVDGRPMTSWRLLPVSQGIF